MLGERFVYLRISDICIGPGNMDGERAKNVGRRRNWQSFFPSSSPILRFTPPPPSSPEQSRGSFETPRASSSRAIAPFISFISELPFDHQPFTLLPVAVGCRSIFVILENGVSRKETDFTRERALYARLNPIFLFLLLQICRNF